MLTRVPCGSSDTVQCERSPALQQSTKKHYPSGFIPKGSMCKGFDRSVLYCRAITAWRTWGTEGLIELTGDVLTMDGSAQGCPPPAVGYWDYSNRSDIAAKLGHVRYKQTVGEHDTCTSNGRPPAVSISIMAAGSADNGMVYLNPITFAPLHSDSSSHSVTDHYSSLHSIITRI
ncbi:hypothetical protein J6590_063790 [Homalodisca vitripennis]|nr:hypothetical protein J6590_063790 [Homalodisca vitripennis]